MSIINKPVISDETDPVAFIVEEPRTEDVALIRRFGGAISHAVLDPAFRIFRVPAIPGLIGFRKAHGHAVVLGDPVCDPSDQASLAEAFLGYTKANDLSAVFAVSSRALVDMFRQRGGGVMEFGELLIGNPQNDPEAGSRGGHLRTSVRFPQRQGVSIREYRGDEPVDSDLERRIMQASSAWRGAREGFQMHIGSHHFFRNRRGCRWFVAEHEGVVVGVLSILAIQDAGCSWLIDLVFSTPGAPTHTNALLIVTAFKALRQEGVDAVCLGVAPAKGLGDISGFSRIKVWLGRGFYALATRLVPQQGKTFFWKKFGIVRREPLYLLFAEPKVSFSTFRALLDTFNFSSRIEAEDEV